LNAAGSSGNPGVRLVDPLGYLEFISLVSAARIVITGSGGCRRNRRSFVCRVSRCETTPSVRSRSHGTNTLIGSRPVDLVRTTFEALARHDSETTQSRRLP
jgi:UDP-N-acetylglucosamine 2-epimerase (non-hydrolysing)